jgi:dihydroorotate dehydrogenase (fumarate)
VGKIKPNEVDLSTTIAGMRFASCVLGNATGVLDETLEEIETLARAPEIQLVAMKSSLENECFGNPEPRKEYLPDGSIYQAMGLPGLGHQAYADYVPSLSKYGKKISASVAGFTPKDFRRGVDVYAKSGVNLITLNVSCPSREEEPEGLGFLICYDMSTLQKVLMETEKRTKIPLDLKLPAYNDPGQIRFVASIVKQYRISCVTAINSIGNCMVIDREKEACIIRGKKGFGALCGPAARPQRNGAIKGLYHYLKDTRTSIIANGGIDSGGEMFECILHGADAGQIGTHLDKTYKTEGFACIPRIERELREIMAAHGYRTIAEAKGKLKPYGE